METTRPASIAAYIAAQPAPARGQLRHVRRAIRAALPDAEEAIAYGIPAYRLDGRVALYFAGWKSHYAIYPVTAALTEALADVLAPYDMSGRGTVRFPLGEPVPTAVITRIARFRASELKASARTRASRIPPRRRIAKKR
jgi:uncharacterized protein YdhG (YjbR/CyaY superfamily)